MSLYVGGVEDPFVTKTDIKDYFYQFGEIRVINVLNKAKAALVHFTSRASAEKAVESVSTNQLIIKGRKLKVCYPPVPCPFGMRSRTYPTWSNSACNQKRLLA